MHFFRNKIIKLESITLLFPAFLIFLRISFAHRGGKKIIVSLTQHLGDNIASEPLEALIREKYPKCFIYRVIGNPFYSIFEFNPHSDHKISVSCLSEWIYLRILLKPFYKILDLHIDKTFCSKYRLAISNRNNLGIDISNYYNHGNLLKLFCVNAGLPEIDIKPRYWMNQEQKERIIAHPYAVIHVSSNSKEREWTIGKWNQLIDILTCRFGLRVIEVGVASSLNCTNIEYYNFCGKLSFSEIAFNIGNANLFIGIDSAFGHFANCFDIPKLILLGHYSGFKYYTPYSGLSKVEMEDSLIHFNGSVKEISVEEVVEKITQTALK